MPKYDYNIVVIGAGSGGLVTAYIAAALKAKVALVERDKMGGDCLNTGCVPSKAIIRTAKLASQIKNHKKYGIKQASAEIDLKDVMQRVHNVISQIEPHDSVERYTNLGVDCVQGSAKILTPNKVQVGDKILTTKNIVIASGASPFVPSIKGIENIDILTSENLWQLKKLPKKFVVLGGGPIGVEMAQSFARLGSDVSLVEMQGTVLAKEDKDASEIITQSIKTDGVNLLTNHKAKEFRTESGKNFLVVEHEGKDVLLEFDEVLIAIGRKARVKGFGIEELKLELLDNKTVKTDLFMRTNHKNIYAVGDVTGPYQLTHAASHQAWFAAVNSLLFPIFKVSYNNMPWCTFTSPEVATVGLNEQEAKRQNIKFEVTKYGLDDLDRAIAESETQGFVKVLTKPKSDKILGVTIVGSNAGDIISEFVLAKKHGLGLNKILGTIHSYPTWAEANKFAAGNWKKANKPEWALNILEKFHNWRRK